MRGVPDPRGTTIAAARQRTWLALALSAVLLAAPAAAATDDSAAYAERVKAVIAHLLERRDFKPEAGCDDASVCADLMARLRAGAFEVIAPEERSERADMPTYLKVRRTCRGLDLTHIVAAHRRSTATRNFALYRLDVARPGRKGEQVLVFRAQHYVATDGQRAGNDEADEPRVVSPGAFIAFGFPSCRMLANAVSTEGDWFAKHNMIDDDDHVSELLRLGDHFFILNLEPIAGPAQARDTWWYALELWDWGARADADLRKRRHIYSFSYRPAEAYDRVGAR